MLLSCSILSEAVEERVKSSEFAVPAVVAVLRSRAEAEAEADAEAEVEVELSEVRPILWLLLSMLLLLMLDALMRCCC